MAATGCVDHSRVSRWKIVASGGWALVLMLQKVRFTLCVLEEGCGLTLWDHCLW